MDKGWAALNNWNHNPLVRNDNRLLVVIFSNYFNAMIFVYSLTIHIERN
jgi:hypothetical protein